jgi:Raf kinase inhibitor-like YbhB/YbcL family protein
MEADNYRQRNNPFRILALVTGLCLVAMLLVSCADGEQPLVEEGEMALSITSAAFQEGGKIPDKYTCKGQDISPALAWSEPPGGTQSFALIMDDPDALGGVFTHWVIFNIPSDSRGLPEAVPTQDKLPSGALQGKNGFGRIGYGGPCPPSGSPHRYQFTLYALRQPLDLGAGASKKQILETMQGSILAWGQLTGTYQR